MIKNSRNVNIEVAPQGLNSGRFDPRLSAYGRISKNAHLCAMRNIKAFINVCKKRVFCEFGYAYTHYNNIIRRQLGKIRNSFINKFLTKIKYVLTGEGGMAFEDYLLPGEEVRFRSNTVVTYGEKPYTLCLTNKRLILYARKGLIFKKDEVVSWKLDEIQGIKFIERGLILKRGIIEIHAKTKIQLEGPSKEMKALYQQLMEFWEG